MDSMGYLHCACCVHGLRLLNDNSGHLPSPPVMDCDDERNYEYQASDADVNVVVGIEIHSKKS